VDLNPEEPQRNRCLKMTRQTGMVDVRKLMTSRAKNNEVIHARNMERSRKMKRLREEPMNVRLEILGDC